MSLFAVSWTLGQEATKAALQSIDSIVEDMEKNNYAFYGAPYFPIETKKRIKNFPVAFCMIVDTEQVDLKDLDFTPLGMLQDGTMADTGYQIYNKYYDYKKWSAYPAAIDQISSADIYLMEKKSSEYFGVHCHAKLHNRNEQERKDRSDHQLGRVLKILSQRKKNDKII